MGGRQDDVGGRAVLVGAQPVGRGHAPAVAGHESGEAVLGHRGAEVVADGALVLEELGGDHRADGVAAAVLGAGSTAPVPVEAGHGVHAAGLKLLAQDAAIVHRISIAPMTNSEIADRLEAFASLLELGDANPYTARAYRRAAETIRGSAAPWTSWCGPGACARCEGSGARSRRSCASWSRRARSPSSRSWSASCRPTWWAWAATSGSGPSARSRSRGRSTSAPPRSCARRRPPAGCGTCRGSGRSGRRSCSKRSRARASRGLGRD